MSTLLFLHGMQSRYGSVTPAQIEDYARRYATKKGYDFEVISVSGDQRHLQEELAERRIRKGGIDAVMGFSAGGYTAARIRGSYPGLRYIIVGAPGVRGDLEFASVAHMDLVKHMAENA